MCSVKQNGASGPTWDVFVKPSRLRGPSGRAGRKAVKGQRWRVSPGKTVSQTQQEWRSRERPRCMGSQHWGASEHTPNQKRSATESRTHLQRQHSHLAGTTVIDWRHKGPFNKPCSGDSLLTQNSNVERWMEMGGYFFICLALPEINYGELVLWSWLCYNYWANTEYHFCKFFHCGISRGVFWLHMYMYKIIWEVVKECDSKGITKAFLVFYLFPFLALQRGSFR